MSTKTNLTLDLTIFTVFLVVYNPHFTGGTIHEWLAVSFAAAILTHLFFHWQWLVKVTSEFFKKFIHPSRLNYFVDALFFIAMTSAFFSGLMISKSVLSTLGIHLNVSQGWKSIHNLASDASLYLLGLHVALHWKWLTSNLNRYLVAPVVSLFRRPTPASQALAVQPVLSDENRN